MAKAFCLLNHSLTNNQIAELKEKFLISEIIYPSKKLSSSWSQIPATETLDADIIKNVIEWLSSSEKNDVFIIQGEFGSTFMLVDYSLQKGLIPVHAVTKRVETEEVNDETVSRHYVFQHVCFRKYVRINDFFL